MNFEEIHRRAQCIDAAVRVAIVSKLPDGEVYTDNFKPTFDKFDMRWAVAYAQSLYVEENPELLAMSLKVSRK